jgi:hypothetical protein
MTANAAGTNGLKCLSKHGGARDNKFLMSNRDNDWPTLLNFHYRTPKRPDRGAIELLHPSRIFNERFLFLTVIIPIFTRITNLQKWQGRLKSCRQVFDEPLMTYTVSKAVTYASLFWSCSLAAVAVVLPNPHWARVVGCGLHSVCVIHKGGPCLSFMDINRFMTNWR